MKENKKIKSYNNTLPLVDAVIDIGEEYFKIHRNHILSGSRIRVYAHPRRMILNILLTHFAGINAAKAAKKFNIARLSATAIVDRLHREAEINEDLQRDIFEFERYVLNRLPI